MTQVISSSGHDDMIHDAVLDYYGRRLATCSSDKTIKIYEIEGDQHRLTETLKGAATKEHDGSVSVLSFENNTFQHTIFQAHGMGVNAVSWSPALVPGGLMSAATGGQTAIVRRIVTGGADNAVKIWSHNAATSSYDTIATLTGHTDWVRDVAWSPTPLSKSYIASASQDHTVRIWTCAAGADQADSTSWKSEVLEFETVCWRCSWSLAGNVLAVSGGDNRVTLWKEKVRGGWECVRTIEE
ncbi:hypothetical protein B0A48_08070 [Cryoendolithus antarcticus]|uniref:Protein transport protein SEC13 n=1 Tax=Cryoendolithus antarcticus TaxID=1507870 RepID=A0A1V8T147_9PEZI|nr:hypothetical protein B0A48_08070 [Cryoendolithus antarcticus]